MINRIAAALLMTVCALPGHAGYTDVSVRVDGIYGWKKAGRPCAARQSR